MISAGERPQTYALDRATAGTSIALPYRTELFGGPMGQNTVWLVGRYQQFRGFAVVIIMVEE